MNRREISSFQSLSHDLMGIFHDSNCYYSKLFQVQSRILVVTGTGRCFNGRRNASEYIFKTTRLSNAFRLMLLIMKHAYRKHDMAVSSFNQ